MPPYDRAVNTVFQDYALFPHMSVAENVAYGLRVARVDRGERARRGDEALEMVGLSGFGGRRPGELSGGQQQRVALARAIVNRPSAAARRAAGALDLKLRKQLQLELKPIQRQVGTTFVYVTHDQEEALAMATGSRSSARDESSRSGRRARSTCGPRSRFVADFIGVSNVIERDGERLHDPPREDPAARARRRRRRPAHRARPRRRASPTRAW